MNHSCVACLTGEQTHRGKNGYNVSEDWTFYKWWNKNALVLVSDLWTPYSLWWTRSTTVIFWKTLTGCLPCYLAVQASFITGFAYIHTENTQVNALAILATYLPYLYCIVLIWRNYNAVCNYKPEYVDFTFIITHLVFSEVKFTSGVSQHG